MDLRSAKFVLLLGILNGVLFYFIYQLVKDVYVKYLWHIKNDNYVYISLPEIYRISRDVGEFFVWVLLFAIASYTAHRFWGLKVKSTIRLWRRVAVVAIGAPIAGLWIAHFLLFLLALSLKFMAACDAPVCNLPLIEMTWLSMREAIDVKFEILLFVVALILNTIYGAAIAKIPNLCNRLSI
jgi:hypothetical protein